MTKEKSLEEELLGAHRIEDLKLSYSKLSSYDIDGPQALIHRKELNSDGIKMGGLVDVLLFEKERLDELYFISDVTKPTATLGQLADIILENHKKMPSNEEILEIVKLNEFWKRTVKEETLIAKFDTEEFRNYIEAQFKSKVKTLITQEEYDKATEIVDILRYHEYSKDIVGNPLKHQEKYVQVEFEYEYKGFIFRGIIDLLIIDHKKKTFEFIDLKTGADDLEAFPFKFIKWRYYFQEAVYQKAFESLSKYFGYTDYSLKNFKFLYISRYERVPLIFEVSDKWHKAAINGFTTNSNYKYKGLDEVVDEIYWHWTNKKFDLSKDIYESKGSITLKDDFIEVNE